MEVSASEVLAILRKFVDRPCLYDVIRSTSKFAGRREKPATDLASYIKVSKMYLFQVIIHCTILLARIFGVWSIIGSKEAHE